jgi:hypothetical protein
MDRKDIKMKNRLSNYLRYVNVLPDGTIERKITKDKWIYASGIIAYISKNFLDTTKDHFSFLMYPEEYQSNKSKWKVTIPVQNLHIFRMSNCYFVELYEQENDQGIKILDELLFDFYDHVDKYDIWYPYIKLEKLTP